MFSLFGLFTKKGLSDDSITRKLENLEIPTPEDVGRLLCRDEIILKSFYLSLALLYDFRRREGRKPYFIHPYSVAVKPAYRFRDHYLPSGFTLTPFGMCLGLIHDLKEEFGEDIVGSYIVGDVVKGFLGEELAGGLELLTNNNDLVYSSIEQSLKRLDVEKLRRLETDDVSDRLEKRLGTLKIDEGRIRNHYRGIIRALNEFVVDIRKYHEELSNEDKTFITDLITRYFITPLSTRLREGDIINPSRLTLTVSGDFKHVINIVNKGPYVEADPTLVYPSESPRLATLEKTFYQDFLNGITEDAYQRFKKGDRSDDSFLEVPLVKVCDSTATVATLEADIVHATHQFRKARRVRESSRGLIERLNQEDFDPKIYQGFQRAIDYLDENLKSSIRRHYELAVEMRKQDTSYIQDVDCFKRMMSKEGMKPRKQPLISVGGLRVL